MGLGLYFSKSPALHLDCRHDLGFTMEDAFKVGQRPEEARVQRKRWKPEMRAVALGWQEGPTSEAGKLK